MRYNLLFSGNSNPTLARAIATRLDLPIGDMNVSRFRDGEIFVELLQNVRGAEVFVVQSVCPPHTNDYLMELCIIADALKRASAKNITAVIPYYGYARQDRRPVSRRVPISAKLVASLLQAAGIDHIIALELHAEQIQGFFDIPLDNIYANPTIVDDIKEQNIASADLCIVSPDAGGIMRARAVAKRLNADMAIIDKRRPKNNESEVMHIIGDVSDKVCVLIDDIIDTAGTACHAATALKENGARSARCYATHPVLSGKAITRIEASVFDEVVVTDSIPLSNHAAACGKIRQISIAPFLSEVIMRVRNEDSISRLFASIKDE